MRAILFIVALGFHAAGWAQSSAQAEFKDFAITLTDLDPTDGTPATWVLDPSSGIAEYRVFGGNLDNSDALVATEFLPAANLSAPPAQGIATSTGLTATTTAPANLYTYSSLFTVANFALSPHSAVSFSGTLAAQTHCEACEFSHALAWISVAANGASVSRVVVDGDEDGNVEPYAFSYENTSGVPVEIRIGLSAHASVSTMPPVSELPTWLLACAGAVVLLPKALRRSRAKAQ
jgi:hypothetical protein